MDISSGSGLLDCIGKASAISQVLVSGLRPITFHAVAMKPFISAVCLPNHFILLMEMKRQSVDNPSQMRRVPEYTDEASDEEFSGTFKSYLYISVSESAQLCA